GGWRTNRRSCSLRLSPCWGCSRSSPTFICSGSQRSCSPWSTCRISARRCAASPIRSGRSPIRRREPAKLKPRTKRGPRRRARRPSRTLLRASRRRRDAAMLELMLCSLFTLVPDYLYRRYVQGKRFGKEITLFSVWYELRWGITGCLMLTIGLITTIFYYHPSTTSALLFYRTIPIAPETNGRVAEVKVGFSQAVNKGTVLFTLDSSKQQAAVETAKLKIAQVDASLVAAKVGVVKAEAQLAQAKAQ